MKKVFLFGYYGYGNLGDELLADYYRTLLAEVFPDRERWILVGKGFYRPLLPGEKKCNRWNLLKLAAATHPGDLWVAGGGSLLQNATSHRTLHYYLSLLTVARARGARTVLLGQGVGPLYGNLESTLTGCVLAKVDLVEARDEEAWRTFHGMGIDSPKLYRGVDPIWNVELPKLSSPGRGLLLILREKELPAVENLVRPALLEGLPVKVVAFDPRDDQSLRRYCSSRYWGVVGDLQDFIAALDGVGAVVSSRLHGVILSAKAGLPVVGLGGHAKIRECCRTLDQAWYAADRGDLSTLYLRMLKASGGERLRQRVLGLAEAAQGARQDLMRSLTRLVGER